MRKGWILLAVLAIAGYFAVFGGEYSWLDLRRLEREKHVQEDAVRATRVEVGELRARADSLERDSIALERLAREKYGLIRSGERLYRFADGAKAQAPAPAPSTASPAAPASPRDTSSARRDSARSRAAAPPARATPRRTR